MGVVSQADQTIDNPEHRADREVDHANERPLEVLIKEMAMGRHSAVRELYVQTSSQLRGTLIKILHQPQDAEEALSDVYMKAWNNAPRYAKAGGGARAWLMLIARNTAIDQLRGKRTRPNAISIEVGNTGLRLSSQGPSPEVLLQKKQRRSEIKGMLCHLSHSQRRLLLMVYFEELTHTQSARALGEPLGTIKSRIRHALSRLRKTLPQ